MSNNKLNFRKTKLPAILFLITLFVGLELGAIFGNAAVDHYEEDLLNESLLRTEITWEVKKALGTFAEDGNHTHDKLKYRVQQVFEGYQVNVSQFIWSEVDFTDYSTAQSSSYYLVEKNWFNLMYYYFSVEDADFGWNTTGGLRSSWNIEYENELLGGKIIDTVTISWYFNETNYDYIKYARAEGILLSRETSINITDGIAPGEDLMGQYQIEMTDFSGQFDVSILTYVIWFVVVLVGTFSLISLVSFLISKKKLKAQSFDY